MIWNGNRLFVAGPDTGPVVVHDPSGAFYAGVRFRPGHAPAVLGLPAAELRDQRADLSELWGARVTSHIEDELASLPPAAAAHTLERHVRERMRGSEATAGVDAVRSRALALDVAALADDIGVTARTLHRRCLHAFGYGAKTLQRVLRFRRFLTLAEHPPPTTLARLAADACYADQSHLDRESLRLSGLTPSALLVSRGVRSVQDTDEGDR